MARFRTIDPKLWQHPFFRKQPWFVRDIFIFLFSSHADDEGRFVADAFAILEGAFSRNHPVTEENVEQALAALEEGGLIVRYDDYGFLLGWYEHQFIDRRYREPSSLAPPPVEVDSWEAAEAIRQEYAKAQNIDFAKAQFRPALRWSLQNEYQEDSATRENHESNTRETHAGREGKGKEGKGKEGTTTSSPPSARETKAERQARLNANEEKLRSAFTADELILVDAYLEIAAGETKSGQITQGGTITRLDELNTVKNEVGHDRFMGGMRAANSAGAPNANYVKKVALSQARAGDSGKTIPARGDVDYGEPGKIEM